jgi:SAM-dependent methyltransferase
MTDRSTECPYCGSDREARCWTAREMMFGMRDVFEYLECRRCGSLRIAAVPTDLDRYYPPQYYSFHSAAKPGRLKKHIMRRWADHSFGELNPIGWLLHRVRGRQVDLEPLLPTGLDRSARILDVGSGGGAVLLKLRLCGFTDLTGVDPFIDADIEYGPGLRVQRRELKDLDVADFDLVIFNHSLEHIVDPRAALRHARERVRPQGWVLVRVPVVNAPWRRYRTNWIEMDPPRHLTIPTPSALERMAREEGLGLDRLVYDSQDYEVWGSEQYARDIPLHDPRSYLNGLGASPFTRGDIRRFQAIVREWNREGISGRASFYFRPTTDSRSG